MRQGLRLVGVILACYIRVKNHLLAALMNKINYLVAIVLGLWVTSGHAVLLTTTLDDVVIGTEIYDVIFHQDQDGFTSFDDVFGSGSSPTLTFSSSSAQGAASAVRNAADAIDFDYTPAGNDNGFILPYAFTATHYDYYTGWSDDLVLDGVFGSFNHDRSSGAVTSFATFSHKGSVPEPTTLALMTLGLAGIGFARKKKQA